MRKRLLDESVHPGRGFLFYLSPFCNTPGNLATTLKISQSHGQRGRFLGGSDPLIRVVKPFEECFRAPTHGTIRVLHQ